jgi:hypothetical protein
MSSAQQAVSSPIASHVDVVVQLPDNTSGTFRVRQITPWDYSAGGGACGEAFGRLLGRFSGVRDITQLSVGAQGDALACVIATAEPLDDNARRHGVRGVREIASLRRLSLAFLDLNVFAPEALRDTGKFVQAMTDRLVKLAGSTGATSSTSPTNSSATATPPSSPTESPSSGSPE